MLKRERNVCLAEKASLFFYWNSFPGAYAYLFTTFSYKCVRHVYGLFCFLFIKIIFNAFFLLEQTNGYVSLDRFSSRLLSMHQRANIKNIATKVFSSFKNLENDLLLCLAENFNIRRLRVLLTENMKEKRCVRKCVARQLRS